MRFEGARLGGEAEGELAYSGSGSVSGTSKRLILNGSSTTTGTVTIQAQGFTQTLPVDNSSTIPTLQLNVRATLCDEAYGDWAYTVQEAFENEGFSATITGWWVGVRESDQVRLHAEDLLRRSTETGADAPSAASESPLLDMAANVVRRYSELADGLRDATMDEVISVLGDAESVLNTLRNLSECDEQLIGEENVAKYITAMTFIIRGLIRGGQDLEPESGEWQLMVQIAARTGAIGAGATDAAAAAEAERALIAEGSEILDEYYDADTDSVEQNEDTIRVLATGAAMNWTYQVGGQPFPARASYERVFGTSPATP